jgi:hypothetical protein
MLRPRESRDLRLVSSNVTVPAAAVTWAQDVLGNAIATASFQMMSDRLVIDSVVRVEDVAAGGYTADRATVRQKKTGRAVRFELSEQSRQAIDDYLKASNKGPASSCSRVVVVRKPI